VHKVLLDPPALREFKAFKVLLDPPGHRAKKVQMGSPELLELLVRQARKD
jgi:hypothetical protein